MDQDYFSCDYYYGRKNSNYNNYDSYDNDRFWKHIVSFIKQKRLGGSFLDVGCAFGFLLKRVQPFFDDVHGLDISTFALAQAQQHCPRAQLHHLDLEKKDLPFADNNFDCITAIDVLEHTNSIPAILAKIYPKLKTSGYFIATVPLRNTLLGRLFHLVDIDKSHVSVPGSKAFLKMITDAGFTIVKKNYSLNFPFLRIPYIPMSLEVIAQK